MEIKRNEMASFSQMFDQKTAANRHFVQLLKLFYVKILLSSVKIARF